ncbi:MAG TPA: hypoxanthine phosphoribosyltransferase [Bacteroidia bacterium]|nr:hypoxanthine phosphoribosyltransferase [Bacteroidia bacterium]HNT79914.1 hypoxanthine phosphoribosyltransferase [Bacteroidia bacterium]
MTEVTIKDKTFEKFIGSERIQKRIEELAIQINEDYQGKKIIFLVVLNGAFLFAADLFRNLKNDCSISFIKLSSYSGTSSSGAVKQIMSFTENVEDRHVVIIEDIVDTGHTAQYLLKEIKKQNPSSVKLASLLFKPEAIEYDYSPDYTGFDIPNAFVIGYGLDYDGAGRNLKDIYQLKT